MVALTRSKTREVLTVLKAYFVEASIASLFKTSVDTSALRASVAIFAGLV